MSYSNCFVLEADLWKVDITEKVWEVRLASMARTPTLSVWDRERLNAYAPGQRLPLDQRICLHVMVGDPDDAAAVQRVREALFLDEDAELPF